LNKKDKEQMQKKLMAKKMEIIDKLSGIANESKELDTGVAQDLVDKAESAYTKEFLLGLSDKEREQLLMIDEALKRMNNDGFGLCLKCQKPIGHKRLQAIPWTPYCIECQQQEEEEESA